MNSASAFACSRRTGSYAKQFGVKSNVVHLLGIGRINAERGGGLGAGRVHSTYFPAKAVASVAAFLVSDHAGERSDQELNRWLRAA